MTGGRVWLTVTRARDLCWPRPVELAGAIALFLPFLPLPSARFPRAGRCFGAHALARAHS